MSQVYKYKPFFDKSVPYPYKYGVLVANDKIIYFGDRRYEQYYDKGGVWKHLNHGDKERRRRYLARARGIKNKYGKVTCNDKNSANYWSIHYLW